MQQPKSAVEFSHPIEAEKIPREGLHLTLEASPQERAALARRLGLMSLNRLEATLDVTRTEAGRMVEVEGNLVADVVQQCVVTLEPLPAQVSEHVSGLFTPPELLKVGAGPVEIENMETEDAEAMKDGIVDVGELVAQHLSLALDPYPRKPGATFAGEGDPDMERVKSGPFAKLAEFRKKTEK